MKRKEDNSENERRNKLKEIQSLFDDGLISKTEYESLRNKIFQQITGEDQNKDLEIKRLKMLLALSIPSQSGLAIAMFPHKKFILQNEVTIQRELAQTIWNELKKDPSTFINPTEPTLKPTLEKIISSITPQYWIEKSMNRRNQTTVPDLIISQLGPNWNPQNDEHRKCILLDCDLKRKFDPQKELASDSSYPGDTRKAYQQMLARASQAFKLGHDSPYFYIMVDLESITFWKITTIEIKPYLEVECSGPHRFGGCWATIENGYKVTFPRDLEDPPIGFQLLVSFISFLLKASAISNLDIINNETNTLQRYYPQTIIGIGRHSIVFAATNESNETVCLKIEPIGNDNQITNELSVLSKLNGCKGVPKLLFSGTTSYLSKNWKAIVTDVVGGWTLANLRNKLSIPQINSYANMAIDILLEIHKRGIIHNDLKPEHFVFCNNEMFLIDYGSATPINSKPEIVTPKYTSPDFYCDFGLNENSDFESLWFSLITLFQSLPWDDACLSDLDVFCLKLKMLPEKFSHPDDEENHIGLQNIPRKNELQEMAAHFLKYKGSRERFVDLNH